MIDKVLRTAPARHDLYCARTSRVRPRQGSGHRLYRNDHGRHQHLRVLPDQGHPGSGRSIGNSGALFSVLAIYPPPAEASTAVNRANIPPSPAVVVNVRRPTRAIFAPSALIREQRAERIHQPWPKPVCVKHQAAWKRSTPRGGARVGRPRWARMRAITGGSSTPALSLSKGRR